MNKDKIVNYFMMKIMDAVKYCVDNIDADDKEELIDALEFMEPNTCGRNIYIKLCDIEYYARMIIEDV